MTKTEIFIIYYQKKAKVILTHKLKEIKTLFNINLIDFCLVHKSAHLCWLGVNNQNHRSKHFVVWQIGIPAHKIVVNIAFESKWRVQYSTSCQWSLYSYSFECLNNYLQFSSSDSIFMRWIGMHFVGLSIVPEPAKYPVTYNKLQNSPSFSPTALDSLSVSTGTADKYKILWKTWLLVIR